MRSPVLTANTLHLIYLNISLLPRSLPTTADSPSPTARSIYTTVETLMTMADPTQPAADSSPSGDATSRSPPAEINSAAGEVNSDTESIAAVVVPADEDSVAAPGTDDGPSASPIAAAANDVTAESSSVGAQRRGPLNKEVDYKRSTSMKKANAREQEPFDPRETFRRVNGQLHVDFSGKVHGTDLTYQQHDIIPEIHSAPADQSDSDVEDNEPEFYVLPARKDALVPPKRKGLLWKYDEDNNDWYRDKGSRWKPSLVLRCFRTDTNEYVKLNARLDLFANVDPNDKAWYDPYNKSIHQWTRRATGEVTVVHKLWQPEELAVVYRAINGVVFENGLDAFCLRFPRGFVRTLTVSTNAVRGLARSVDGLHSLLRRSKGLYSTSLDVRRQ
jgi:hypothetical protein